MNTKKPVVSGKRGVIAAGHFLATSAGLKMFAKGGNAVDAGVAAGFALAVLKPHQNTLGGECPMLIYSPKSKEVVAISGQGVAPEKATIQWFKDNGIEAIPGDGFLGATVPGTFGSYCTALMNFGTLTLNDVLEPAIELAEEGFPVYKALREAISGLEKKFREEWPTSAEVFLPDGKLPEIGQVLKQPALAKTFKSIANAEKGVKEKGREAAIQNALDYYYKGEIAEKILEFAKNNPIKDASGKYNTTLLEAKDFKSYSTRIEKPVSADYKNYTVFKCGPWTQGPVFLQQLKILEGFNINKMGHNSSEYIHHVIEASKVAFADREKYYGDPLFSKIPLDKLLSEDYNETARKSIDPCHANNENLWEMKEAEGEKVYIGDTTHLDVIDSDGLMVSFTPSGGWIPSSPVIPTVGFPLGTRAQMFNFIEGHPNSLAPGKRPRTTLTPSMAFKDGKPWMAFGTPGGDGQDQWTLQYFLNVVEFGMNMQQAVDAATFHSAHFPSSFYPHGVGNGIIYVEEGIDRDVLYKLQDFGHKLQLKEANSNGEVCAVRVNHKTGVLEGVASSKGEGNAYALGW